MRRQCIVLFFEMNIILYDLFINGIGIVAKIEWNQWFIDQLTNQFRHKFRICNENLFFVLKHIIETYNRTIDILRVLSRYRLYVQRESFERRMYHL